MLFCAVDFGPAGVGPMQAALAVQRSFNPPGLGPFLCSEFYTGWLTHWVRHALQGHIMGMA